MWYRILGGGGQVTKAEALAVAALATIVVAATVDAFRREGDEEPTTTTTAQLVGRDALAAQATHLGVRGQLLLYGYGCHVQLLTLPSLERTEDSSGCVPRGAVSPDGSLVARCLGDETELVHTHSASAGVHGIVPGCAPAWRPDGTLTVARGRAVIRFRACPGPRACAVTLITRSTLERAARRHPTVPTSRCGHAS